MLAEIKADREADRKELKEMMDANTKAMREDIKSGQAEVRSIVKALHENVDACVASRRDDREVTVSCQEMMEPRLECEEPVSEDIKACQETTTCHEATEGGTEKTEPDPGTMHSVEEHEDIPKEEATVMPVGGLRKRRRDQNLTAGRRQKLKGRIRASCESRRRSTIAGRKMTRRSTVAWRRRNAVRQIGTQENCRPRKDFTAAGIRLIHCAGVEWLKRGVVRNYCTKAKAERATQRL
jgi:hypothetical protein